MTTHVTYRTGHAPRSTTPLLRRVARWLLVEVVIPTILAVIFTIALAKVLL